MCVVHQENRKGDDDERQFVHLSLSPSRIEREERKREASICPIASGPSLKCRHE